MLYITFTLEKRGRKIGGVFSCAPPPTKAEIALTVRPLRALCLKRFYGGVTGQIIQEAKLPGFPAPSTTVAAATGYFSCELWDRKPQPFEREQPRTPPLKKGGLSVARNPRRSLRLRLAFPWSVTTPQRRRKAPRVGCSTLLFIYRRQTRRAARIL